MPAGLLVATVALYGHVALRARGLRWIDPAWWRYRAAEWAAIALGSRLLLYAIEGPGPVTDFEWESFVANLAPAEYGLALLVLAAVWAFATALGTDLLGLLADPADLAMGRESGRDDDRLVARRRLVGRVLAVGGGLVLLLLLARSSLPRSLASGAASAGPAIAVTLYFALALALLALTNLTILRGRWCVDSVPVGRGLASTWLLSGLVFFAAVGLLTAAVPTSYTYHLLDIVEKVLGFGQWAFAHLIEALYAAFAFVASLLTWLLVFLGLETGQGQTGWGELPVAPPAAEVPADSGEPVDWTELLSSVVCWALFLGVAALVVSQYVRRSERARAWLRLAGLGGWLSRLWRAIAARVRHLEHRVADTVRAGVRRLGAAPTEPSGGVRRGYVSLRRLSPRERVEFYYAALLYRGRARGYPRRRHQTPDQYQESLEKALPELDRGALGVLTAGFLEARYSRHPIDAARAARVRAAWSRLRLALRPIAGVLSR